MKKSVLAAILLATSLAGCARAPASLPQVSPEDAGLSWRECSRTADWAALEACFGHPPPAPEEVDTARSGMDTAHGHRLEIGADVYETREASGLLWNTYTLYKNGRAIATLRGGRDSFEGRSPDLSLTNIGGKAAWAFYDRVRDQATIVYDGQDVRTLYGLDRAIAPYEIDGKLIFLGNRAGRSLVVYDGRQVGADWPGRLSLALCCEGVLYNPRYGGGRYMFAGGPNGAAVCVEMAANGAETEEQRVEQVAREHMSRVVGAAAVERSRVEIRPFTCGWLVVFRDAEARCGDGPFWPGACRFGPAVFRDVYACILRNGQIQQVGASQSPLSLDAEDRCQCAPDGASTIAPEPTAAPISMAGSCNRSA